MYGFYGTDAWEFKKKLISVSRDFLLTPKQRSVEDEYFHFKSCSTHSIIMVFVVENVTLEDFVILESYGSSEPEHGDLISPFLATGWPASTTEERIARNTWGTAQQREIFLHDPTAVFMKVVDTETQNIISMSRWHRYPQGYDYLKHSSLEFNAFTKSEIDLQWPTGINEALYKGLLRGVFPLRQKWQKPGPCWICATLMTRTGYHRKGAGRMLIEWGLERANKTAFLHILKEALMELHSIKDADLRSWMLLLLMALRLDSIMIYPSRKWPGIRQSAHIENDSIGRVQISCNI